MSRRARGYRPTMRKARGPRSSRVAAALALACITLAAPSLHAQELTGDLTPETAIARAFSANPDARVQRLNVDQARAQLEAAEGARVPLLVAGTSVGVSERFSGTPNAIAKNVTQTLAGNLGLRYTTDVGTVLSFDVSTNAQQQQINPTPAVPETIRIGPNYSANTTLTVRQPLLRGAGREGQLGAIVAAAASLNQAERTREANASVLMRDVLISYWELWYADRALALQRQSLVVAEQQLEQARLRAETLGTAARSDMFRFATERSSILESVTSAEASRRARAFELGRLLGMAPELATALTLNVAAPVVAEPVEPSIATDAALLRAPDLAALQQQIQAAAARLATARNAARTRLDVLSTLGANGLWADDDLDGLRLPGDRPALVGTIGLELELPAGSSQLDGNLAAALASKAQAEASLESRQAQIRLDVALSHESLRSALARLGQVQESVDSARSVAEAEQQRLTLGTATPADVIVAQQTHRAAELRWMRTLIDAAVASTRLQHATGQLLAAHRDLASIGGAAP